MDETGLWNRAASDFQQILKQGQNEYNGKLFEFLVGNCGLKPGIRVVDVGCGVGKYGMMLASMGCEVCLTDISPEMLRYAEGNMSAFDTPWSCICGDFSAVSEHLLSGGKFDLAISTMSPAVHDKDTVLKFSNLSRGCCFLSRFTSWEQPMRDRLLESLGAASDAHYHSEEKTAALIEAVRSSGFEPKLSYVDYNWCDMRTAEETADYLKRRCGLSDHEDAELIEAVKPLLNEKGLFADAVYTKVLWMYWSV